MVRRSVLPLLCLAVVLAGCAVPVNPTPRLAPRTTLDSAKVYTDSLARVLAENQRTADTQYRVLFIVVIIAVGAVAWYLFH